MLYLAVTERVFALLSQQQTDTQEGMEDRQLELVTSEEEGGERAPRENAQLQDIFGSTTQKEAYGVRIIKK